LEGEVCECYCRWVLVGYQLAACWWELLLLDVCCCRWVRVGCQLEAELDDHQSVS